jgi:hypothetical protein
LIAASIDQTRKVILGQYADELTFYHQLLSLSVLVAFLTPSELPDILISND